MLAALSVGKATSLLQAQERSLRAFLMLCFPPALSRAQTPHHSFPSCRERLQYKNRVIA